MTLDETGDSFKDVVVRDGEVVDKVHEDVVAVGGAVLDRNNLESIQDSGDKAVGLGDKVLGSVHATSDTARAHQRTNEEAVVQLVLPSNAVVKVELRALGEARREVVVRQAAKLELECKGRFDVTNGLFFLPRATHLAERVVDRILTRTADEDGDTTNTALAEDITVTVDELDNLLIPSVLRHVIGVVEDTQRQVQDVGRLVVDTVALLVLVCVKVGEHGSDLVKATFKGGKVREGRNCTSPERLLLMRVDHVRQVADRRLPTRQFTVGQ